VPVMVPNSPRPAETPVMRSDIDEPETVQEVDDEPVVETDAPAATDDTDGFDATVETIETVEEAMEADPIDGIVVTATADEVVEPVVEPVVEDEAVEDEAVEDEAVEDEAVEARDDVVVDLFARLRADSSLVVVVDDTGDEPEQVPDTSNPGTSNPGTSNPGTSNPGEAWDELDAANEATPFDQRDADLTPLIVASAKKLKRVLADEQNEVLDALRRREPVRQLSDLLPTPADHLARFRVAIVDDLLAAANAGASLVTPGRVARVSKADATKAAQAGDAVLDEWLIVPLRERLDRCVADGDGDNPGIAKRVRAVYRECKTQHIDEQLDDVIRAAHGSGLFSVIESGTAVDWVSDPSHAACADCNDNTLGGAVAAGVAFPTGHLFPPAHLGCRCLLLPAER